MRNLLLVGAVCLAIANIGSLQAQELKVKSAAAKVVELEWTGGTGGAVLERAAGAAFQKMAPGDAGHYQDTSIDAFGTYQYRINAAGKFSNVVTVGPPPAGVTNAATVPKGTDPPMYGPAMSVTLDENGDPVIAFEWIDPNGDGEKADSEIRFVRWDRAAYKWAAPVRIAVTGPLEDQNVNPIALGFDRTAGTVVLLAAVGEKLLYASSTDHGATWKSESIAGANGSLHAVSVMVASGQVYAAVNAESGATYTTGAVADSSSWKSKAIPAGSGWKLQNHANIAIAADANGRVGLAFQEDQEEGDGHRYVFWRPESAELTVIEGNGGADSPDISLTYGGKNFGAIFAAALDSNDTDHTVWFSGSADGAAWSKPVKLPIDGPRTTNPPFSLASSSKGALTAAFSANGGSAAAACGAPSVSRSSDGTNWKTCGLGKAAGAEWSPQPTTIHAIESPNDKAYVVWQEPAESKYSPGVMVWHEK